MPDAITPASNIRDVVARYPGIERVFDRHGLAGCGGDSGPDEAIGLFARVHHVEPFALVAELNSYAKAGSAPVALTAPPVRQRDTYRLFVGTSLALAVVVGFSLALAMPLTQALHVSWGNSWMAHVQSHGHAQLFGFAALFTMGIALHVVPRFKATTLRFPSLVMPTYLLAVSGVLLRLLAQPAAGQAFFAALLGLSGLLELGAAVLFAIIIVATVRTGQREFFDPFLVAGALGFALQATANAAVVADAARLRETVIPLTRDNAQIQLMLYGALLPFIYGISLRTLPAFLGIKPPPKPLLFAILGVHLAGLVEIQAVSWVQEVHALWSPPAYLLHSGPLALGLAMIAFALSINPLEAEPPDGGHHVAEGYLKSAYAWLGIAGGLQTWFVARAWLGGDYVSLAQIDGVRHSLALGFITMMIVGMATRVLPVFAGRRLYSQFLAASALWMLNVAALTRAVGGLMADTSYMTDRYWVMAVAGTLGLLALILFAWNLYRTLTSEPPGISARARALAQH